MQGGCHWRNEVIVMTSARWGRMETGRCLEIHPNSLAAQGHDPLFLGCFEDVLSIMDRKCSGRSACNVRVSDELNDVRPCYPDLTRYLQYSYECVKGKILCVLITSCECDHTFTHRPSCYRLRIIEAKNEETLHRQLNLLSLAQNTWIFILGYFV